MANVSPWYMEFVATVVARLPRDIDEATVMSWLRHTEALEEFLAGLHSPAGKGDGFQHDKSKQGWELVEDALEPGVISGAAIELEPFFEEDHADLLGDAMVAHVQQIDEKLGQRHAEYLLHHQEEIPEDFRRYSLVFPGTIWRGSDGNHHVPCLNWRQGTWELVFGILEAGVEYRDRLVRPRR